MQQICIQREVHDKSCCFTDLVRKLRYLEKSSKNPPPFRDRRRFEAVGLSFTPIAIAAALSDRQIRHINNTVVKVLRKKIQFSNAAIARKYLPKSRISAIEGRENSRRTFNGRKNTTNRGFLVDFVSAIRRIGQTSGPVESLNLAQDGSVFRRVRLFLSFRHRSASKALVLLSVPLEIGEEEA